MNISGFTVINGDAVAVLRELASDSIDCCVTSPPYFGLRDYGMSNQIGRERSVDAYVESVVSVFREVRRVLKNNGTLWLNLNDTYAANRSYQCASTKGGAKHSPAQGNSGPMRVPDGLKSKDLIGIPWKVAFALQADGWYLRQDIIWNKPNAMPESVKDRCVRSHEYIFLLSKSAKYYYNIDAMKEPSVTAGQVVSIGPKSFSKRQSSGANVAASGNALNDTYTVKPTRNKRSVWNITTKPFKGAHCAVFPIELPYQCILAGAPPGGVVLDPFSGAGTTGIAALSAGRSYMGIELNGDYVSVSNDRARRFLENK